MRRIFNSKKKSLKMLSEAKGIGFRKDGKLWVGSPSATNKTDEAISKKDLILLLPTDKQLRAAGLNPGDAQTGQLLVFSTILYRLGLFTNTVRSKKITISPSTVKNVKKYSDLFISYFKKFPEDIDIKVPRFFMKNNITDIQFNIGVPLSYLMNFAKDNKRKNDWSNFTDENKLYGNLLSSYEYEYENLSKDVKDTHASVLRRMGLVGGNGTFSKSADYDTIHGEELSASGILDKARDTFKDYKVDKDDDEKVLSDDEDDYDEDEKPQRNRDDYKGFDYYNDENEEYFYESIEDDDLLDGGFSDDAVPRRSRRSIHDELTDDIIDDTTKSSSAKNGYSTEDIRTLEEKYGSKAEKATAYLLPIFKEAKKLGVESPADFKKYASDASAVSSIIRDKKLLNLEGCEDIYQAIFKNDYLSTQECIDDINKFLGAASHEEIKVNSMTAIWKHASQVLNDINDDMLDSGIKNGAKNQEKLFSRIVTQDKIDMMSDTWDIPKEEISNCNTILELLEVLYKPENLAKIYNSLNVNERPREKGNVRIANKGLVIKNAGRRVKNAEDNKVIYDKEMVKAVDDAKLANLQAKFEKLKAEQEELGKKRLELRMKLDSLDTLDPKYDEIEDEIKDLNGEILRKSRNASSIKVALNKIGAGTSHTRKQKAVDRSETRYDNLSKDFEGLSQDFMDDLNVGNNDEEAKRRAIKRIRDKVGVRERKPDMKGLVNALQNSASNLTISFFIRSLDYKDTVPTSVRRQFVDKFINTFTKELNVRPEDYGSLFSVEDIPIKDMYEYSEDPEESDFYDSEEYNEPDKLDIKYRNGIEVRITYPKRGEFHKFLKKLLKTLPQAIDNWLKKTTKSIINDGNDIRVAYSKTIVEI